MRAMKRLLWLSALLANHPEGAYKMRLIDYLLRRADFKSYAMHLDYNGVRATYLHKRRKWFWQRKYKRKGVDKID